MKDLNYNIYEELKKISKIGTISEKKIAQYLLEQENEVVNLKLEAVSQACYVSPATVTRFARKIDLSSFSELKLLLSYQKDSYKGMENTEDEEFSLERHYQNVIQSIETTKRILNKKDVLNVAKKMIEAEEVDIYALGETNIMAKDFNLKLIRLGYRSSAHSDIHTQHFMASSSNKKTVAIGITYSGTTKEVSTTLKTAKENGATTVLITNRQGVVAKEVDYVLNVEATESIARTFSATSRFSILYVLDVLLYTFIELNHNHFAKRLDETRLIKR